jgi:hypothetical protein
MDKSHIEKFVVMTPVTWKLARSARSHYQFSIRGQVLMGAS